MNPYFNESTVLEFIKSHLGYPFNIIELSDDYLIKEIICSQNYVKEFSQYFPKEERIELKLSDAVEAKRLDSVTEPEYNYDPHEGNNAETFKTTNRFKLNSKNEIIGVKSVVNHTFYGNPNAAYLDMMYSMNPMNYATENYMLSMVQPPCPFRFYYPNILEIYGLYRNLKFMVTMHTVHNSDLSSIPSSLHMKYNKFCLYTAAKFIYAARSKYETMSTPFGEIAINIGFIKELADKKEELIAEFEDPANLNATGRGIYVC